MKLSYHLRLAFVFLICFTSLLLLPACSSPSQNESSSTVAESVAESATASAPNFLFSNASWDTSPDEIEAIEGKTISTTSFLGHGDKSYEFHDVVFNEVVGTNTYTYRDNKLWKVTFHYLGRLATEKSDAIVALLNETYHTPTLDKSNVSEDGTGVWLEWHLDTVNITYMYVSGSSSNNNVITLAYELPDDQIPVIDSSSRNGDFRIGFWGDSIDTINLYETAEYVSTDSDNSGLLFSGKVSNYEADIAYYFDSTGKLYQGIYQITEDYSQGSVYITTYNTLKENLASIYGTPSSDTKKNISSLAPYTDEGTALELGYTVYRTCWETETTTITLIMMSQNYKVNLLLSYEDINHTDSPNTTGL